MDARPLYSLLPYFSLVFFLWGFSPVCSHSQYTSNEYRTPILTLQQEGFDELTLIQNREGATIMAYSACGRFGYLKVETFGGLSNRHWKQAIDKIWTDFSDLEGMIIDLRGAQGKETHLADLLAERFSASSKTVIGRPSPNSLPEFPQPFVLLTHAKNNSTAKSFIQQLSRLPQTIIECSPLLYNSPDDAFLRALTLLRTWNLPASFDLPLR